MSIITLNEDNFESEVKGSSIPVLVSFQPNDGNYIKSVDDIGDKVSSVLKCCKINVGKSPSLAKKYRVRTVPTVLVFKDGKVTDTIVGAMKTDRLLNILGTNKANTNTP